MFSWYITAKRFNSPPPPTNTQHTHTHNTHTHKHTHTHTHILQLLSNLTVHYHLPLHSEQETPRTYLAVPKDEACYQSNLFTTVYYNCSVFVLLLFQYINK